MTKTIGVGMIGLGRIGVLHFNHLIHHVKGVSLKTVCDIDSSCLKEVEELMPDVQFTTDHKLLWDNPNIEAVIICTPTDTHVSLILASAQAGKHVFCEKPIDVRLSAIEKTLNVVAEAGVQLMIGFNRRFDPHYHHVYEAIQQGKLGAPYLVHITSRDPEPPSREYLETSGGLFFDLSIHDWDLAAYLMGSPITEVYSIGTVLGDPWIREINDIDTAITTLRFENNALGMVDNSRWAVYGYDQRLEFFGSQGTMLVDNETTNQTRYYHKHTTSSAPIPRTFLQRFKQSYLTELQVFINAIQQNQPVPVTGDDALQASRVALAAQRSLQQHRPVTIQEIQKN